MHTETFRSKIYQITISDDTISFKKIVVEKNYWFHSLILFSVLGYLFIAEMEFSKNIIRWVQVIYLIMIAFPHLERIFNMIFFDRWGNKIRINNITKIEIPEPGNEFERDIKIWVRSRRKIITFRNAEDQLEKCVAAINARHASHTALVTSGSH